MSIINELLVNNTGNNEFWLAYSNYVHDIYKD